LFGSWLLRPLVVVFVWHAASNALCALQQSHDDADDDDDDDDY